MKRAQSISEKIEAASGAEQNGALGEATRLFEDLIKENLANQKAYDRLMIIYRKHKAYKEELRVIKRGILVFKEQAKKILQENIAARKNKKQLVILSNAFMKGAGLLDKKGNATHIPEPINRWLKRQEVVEKKIKASKKNK